MNSGSSNSHSSSPPAAPSAGVALWAVVAAFGAYFCMYAFRKPFSVAEFAGEPEIMRIDYKSMLIAAQLLGYTLSKFIGIKIIAEMPPAGRAAGILILVGIAQIALLLFGLIPAPWNVACLFLNGLPLGMVFGLVVGFLEGRQLTEALTAGLCTSFIVADGAVKSVGKWLLMLGVSEMWMPFVTGLLFALPLVIFVYMLSRVPPPTAADVAARTERKPMPRGERHRFFGRHALGLTLLLAAYLLITILRTVRSDFSQEIWRGLGVDDQPAVFVQSEGLIALFVLVLVGLSVLIRNNRRAFFTSLGMSLAGMALAAAALLALRAQAIAAFPFMFLLGLGFYLPYVAVHTTIFERLIAMTRERANIGYLITLADAFGYLGVIPVAFSRNFLQPEAGIFPYFIGTCWIVIPAALGCLAVCTYYFHRQGQRLESASPLSPALAEESA